MVLLQLACKAWLEKSQGESLETFMHVLLNPEWISGSQGSCHIS